MSAGDRWFHNQVDYSQGQNISDVIQDLMKRVNELENRLTDIELEANIELVLREANPALKDAYEQYMTVRNLVNGD